MFEYIYLHELFLGQCHISCFFLRDLHCKVGPMVCYDGLDACLVMQLLHESFTCFG